MKAGAAVLWGNEIGRWTPLLSTENVVAAEVKALNGCEIVLVGAVPCEDAGTDGMLCDGPLFDDDGLVVAGPNWDRKGTGGILGLWLDEL